MRFANLVSRRIEILLQNHITCHALQGHQCTVYSLAMPKYSPSHNCSVPILAVPRKASALQTPAPRSLTHRDP